MKRLISWILTLVVLTVMLVPAQSVAAAAAPTISLESLQAHTGESVQMHLTLQGNPGIVATSVHVQYDPAVLQLTDVQNGEVFPSSASTFGNDLSATPYTVLWLDALSSQNYTANGVLATLTFQVLPGAKTGASILTVTYDANSTFDCDLHLAPAFATVNGSVTVQKQTVPVTGVSLPSSISMTAGEKTRLTATVEPSNATNRAITWMCSPESVAKVDADGNVTALQSGTATVTVTTKDGGKTASCVVTVRPATVAVTGVSIPGSLTMNYKDSARLTATVEPSNATNPAVSWRSSDSKVVEVDANGNLTTHKAGTATITVVTADGGKAASCNVTVQYTFVQKIIIYLLFGWLWYVK